MDPTPQDYNLCSPERRALLESVDAHLIAKEISPALWAAFQLADLERLKAICDYPVGTLILLDDATTQIVTQCNVITQSHRIQPLTGSRKGRNWPERRRLRPQHQRAMATGLESAVQMEIRF